ncbi:hypothetical protein HQN87_27595 [Paenibacillus tritici]|uniref:Flp pilus-assembly TadG-like N-terminal domain-containing protein n=1 Tax=Paenibacillus tritici TaxID=1873425 RepID=A0ABX2DWL9_9BACL|nr:hypothetical protein [Paenibacillus tritici]NQX49095.1 hypothetical protein [Paenibacillus tritici]
MRIFKHSSSLNKLSGRSRFLDYEVSITRSDAGKGLAGYTFRGLSAAEGSVSIFLIMVLAFVFLFNAVLIDYARIAAVNVQEERLARAAIRSVMSAYDIELREGYGLFAFGGGDGNQLMSKVLNDNLYESGRGDAFNLLPVMVDSSSLDWSRPLGSYEVFRRQIIEEMKYKAPVDFALELAGKLKPLSAAMTEASRTTNVLGDLQPLYDQREEALDLMLRKRREAADSARKLQKLLMDPPGNSISALTLGPLASGSDIPAMYGDYVNKYYEDYYRDSKRWPRYTAVLSRYENQTLELAGRIPAALADFQESNNRLLEEAAAAFEQVKALNLQMKSVIEQANAEASAAGDDPARSWDIPETAGELSSEPLKKLREQVEGLILPSSEISEMENNIGVQRSAALPMEPVVSSLPAILSTAAGLYADHSLMTSGVLDASQAVNGYIGSYGQHGTVIAAEAARIESRRTSDGERKQIERQAKEKLGDAMNLLDQIRALGGSAGEGMEQYRSLRRYHQENVSFNEGVEQEPAASVNTSSHYAAGQSSMKDMDGIYAAMGSVLEGARDRLYQTEYSAMYFRHFDLSALTSLASGSAEGAGEQLGEQLKPQAQELEYILYGFYNPAGNVASAYGEIFAMRLAVRTMEGMIEKSGLGNPLVVLAAALLYGIEQAIQDMILLCTKGEIPLSKYMTAKLSYRDYLRLFLLLHGGGEEQLARMLALIRLNTGINPIEKFTYASTELTLGMPLWFLPGVVKLVDYSAGLPGDIRGKTYFRTVGADFSY